jgi:hypothetical protein
MQRREQTSLGVVAEGGSSWRKVVSAAYDGWKTGFDAHCAALSKQQQHLSINDARRAQEKEFGAFVAAYNAVYHAAQALLNMDFLDVQIYAGARHIVGRPVQQKDYIRSSQVVKRWVAASRSDASEQESLPRTAAAKAAWHASRLLLDATGNLTDSEAMGLFHVPWCLYLATLTCWAVHHARPNRAYGSDADMDADEMVWDPEGEMKALITDMANTKSHEDFLSRERRRTTGLVWVMADVLTKVRWGIIRAGVVVLRGLVPQRLINQYEENF